MTTRGTTGLPSPSDADGAGPGSGGGDTAGGTDAWGAAHRYATASTANEAASRPTATTAPVVPEPHVTNTRPAAAGPSSTPVCASADMAALPARRSSSASAAATRV